jgi:phosphoenolpyruvate carboxykinase (GTP)
LPKIYYVNWFRKNAEGKFIWPGYGENSRVLKWIFERIDGTASAQKTPIGNLPTPESLDISGLKVNPVDFASILSVDLNGWRREAQDVREYYRIFENKLPKPLADQLDQLEQRLK